jgi:hypothetical protein
MDFFKQIGDLAGSYLPWFQEYGNALLSPLTGGLEQQPLGGSGLYGYDEQGNPRSMGGAMDYIIDRANERDRLIKEIQQRTRR